MAWEQTYNTSVKWLLMILLLNLCAGLDANVTTESSCPVKLKERTGDSNVTARIEKHEIALLLLLGFGGFSLIIARLYNSIRKHVFHDEYKLDTIFDAGGRVSLSLTAVTVTSQMLWPADFIYTSTIISKSGLGGTLWYAVGIVIDIALFPALSIYLKSRAPGAKTFPQIAYARFGNFAHIIFCILALITNLITSVSVLMAGRTTIHVFCKNSNTEFIMLILAVLFGSYCLVGGLGTTFYISYFNTALTFAAVSVYILYTSIFPSDNMAAISSKRATYDAISCIVGPEGNYGRSFLTFRSRSGVIYGIVMMFMATSISFCDQANWQSRIAAKPSQGVIGFFLAAYMWFVVPTAMSFTAAMSYFSMSFQNGTHLLSQAEIDDGYITPYVMETLLGRMGGYLLTSSVMMALMSTGSGEVMAISSIIVYDIYRVYINPFRKHMTPTSCILCGKQKVLTCNTFMDTSSHESDECSCPSSKDCRQCQDDIKRRITATATHGIHYYCPVHGDYRHYEDDLIQYKNWCMIWIVISIVPFGILIIETGMNVFWATVGIPVIASPFLTPLFCTITWSKATGSGVISGSIVGLVCSIAGLLIMGSTYEGGLSDFYVNTAQDYSLLCAMVSGFFISTLICISVSLCTTRIQTEDDKAKEWAKTINIDNPLNPFRLLYKEELDSVGAGPIVTAKTMDGIFKRSKFVAIIGACASLVVFLIIVPAVALSFEVLSYEEYTTWVTFFQVWVFVSTVLVIVVPPIEEGLQIWRKFKENKVNLKKQNDFTLKETMHN